VPHTLFVLAELLPPRFMNARSMQRFEDAVRAGFYVPAPARLVPKGMDPKRYYLIPMSIASKKNEFDLHQRSISTRIKSGGKKYDATLKGTGSYFGYSSRFARSDSPVLYPFDHISEDPTWAAAKEKSHFYYTFQKSIYDNDDVSMLMASQAFFGGETTRGAREAIEAGKKLGAEFGRALREKDPVVIEALKRGVIHPLVPVPTAIFRPLQTIVEFQKRPNQEKDVENFRKGLSEKERRAFDFLYRRAENGKTIELKLEKGLEMAGLGKSYLRKRQIVQAYSTESNIRISELPRLYGSAKEGYNGNLPLHAIAEVKPFRTDRGTVSDPAPSARKGLEHWIEAFRLYGYTLRPGKGEEIVTPEGKVRDYAVYRKGRRASMESARRDIMANFATRIALSFHVAQTRLGASFQTHFHGEQASSAMKPEDITLKGETTDLDSMDFKPDQWERRSYMQRGGEGDRGNAHSVIQSFARMFIKFESAEQWERERKEFTDYGIGIFERLVEEGRRFAEAQKQQKEK
jgi:hypothetical protein